MDVTVVVATYGDADWMRLARDRALPSAAAQTLKPAVTLHLHGASLHEARNEALSLVDTPWVVFLDADDELDPGYLQHLADGTADLRAPAVSYIAEHRIEAPRVPRVAGHHHDCTADCLPEGNWLVIGTMARTATLRDAGGFPDYPVYEDWAAWLKCWTLGATVEAVPAAVYRAYWRRDSRNRAPDQHVKDETHRQIVHDILGARV